MCIAAEEEIVILNMKTASVLVFLWEWWWGLFDCSNAGKTY
jgi:hypothetical protein